MCIGDLNETNSCIRDILKVIFVLQENVEEEKNELETCDKRTLGPCCRVVKCNTRPVMLYTACSNGDDPWKMPVSKDPNETDFSSVFRVEKLEGNCCTFRVLKQVPCEKKNEFTATNSFFTMNLGCICCIRCLEDTFVKCI